MDKIIAIILIILLTLALYFILVKNLKRKKTLFKERVIVFSHKSDIDRYGSCNTIKTSLSKS